MGNIVSSVDNIWNISSDGSGQLSGSLQVSGGLQSSGEAIFNKKIQVSGLLQIHKTEIELKPSSYFYSQIAFTGANSTESELALVTGAWVLNTPIPRISNDMFRIRVYGYGYNNQFSSSTSGKIIDFTTVGYVNQFRSGTEDGVPGAVIQTALVDLGTDQYPKYVGVNSQSNLAIAFGNQNTVSYFWRLLSDALLTFNVNSGVFSTGWYFSIETGINFGFKDLVPLTGIPFSGHVTNSTTGVLLVGKNETGVYTNTFVSKTETGAYDNTFISHVESGAFYPRSGNPSGYLTSANTGILVGKNETGIFDNTFVSRTESGSLTGAFYPRNGNPSGFLISSDTGVFYPGSSNPSGYIRSSETGAYTNTFVQKTETGVFDNTFISHTESGNFYPRVGNPSGFLLISDLSTYITTSQTGILVGENETGQFRLLSDPRTGYYQGPTLFSGRTRHLMDSEAYFYPIAAYFKADTPAITGAWVINTPIPRDSLAMFKLDIYGHEFGTSSVIDLSVIGYAYNGVTGHDGIVGRFFSHGITDNSNRNHAKWVGINSGGNIAIAIGNTGDVRNFQRMWVDASVHRLHNTFSGRYLTGWSITINTGSGISSGGAVTFFGFKDMESGTNGIEYHNHDAGSLTAGVVPSARMVGSYSSITSVGTLTSLTVNGNVSLTGQVAISGQAPVTKNQTGIYTNEFYPLNSNPVGYITSASLIGYVQSSETGILVGKDITGSYFYPRFQNPSSYLTSADLLNYSTKTDTGTLLIGKDITGTYFYPRNQNPSGYLTSADLSSYATKTDTGNLLVGRDITGTFFYPRNQNPNSYLTSADLSSYATKTDTGNLLVGKDMTGNYTNVFYPRNTNPNGYAVLTVDIQGVYATTSQTGISLVGKDITGSFFYPRNQNPAGYLTSAGASNLTLNSTSAGASLPPDTETDILSLSFSSGKWLVNSMIQCRGSSEPVNFTYRITDGSTDYQTASIYSESVNTNGAMTCVVSTSTTKTIYLKGTAPGTTNNSDVFSNTTMTALRVGDV
jgi:hypothetical protein